MIAEGLKAEASQREGALRVNLDSALQRLDLYLETSEERLLREHQSDVMESLRDFLASGETAGYLSLPTGFGKTVVAAEIAKVLGKKTLILSPTKQILEQTHGAVIQFTPGVEVGNYYSDEKNLSGTVLNTTYQSLFGLLEREQLNPEEIGLVICDEAHTALGEQRHALFRKFPNAIFLGLTATPYFMPLNGFTQRGLVEEDERWTGLFKNRVHEMSLEEAIERGILTPLDVHLVETNVSVGNVRVTAAGNYDEAEINKYLNKLSRDYLTLGMVAGLNKLPANINLSDKQKEELGLIHRKIEGKRTVIFGLSIAHVNDLAQMLRDRGIKAAAVHSKMGEDDRREILSAYAKGDIQVVLGVDMLRLGWDSPQTEVGIYLAPTQSGIVAVQELGRILRPAEGKEEAIAIQLVDNFQRTEQAPVLIPNIFDPYYILRGTQTGLAPSDKRGVSTTRMAPAITFSGMNIETIVQEALSRELIRSRFKNASISQMDELFADILEKIQSENSRLSAFEMYKKIADAIPGKIPLEAQQEALQALASIDSNISKTGRKIFLYLNLKSILSGVDEFVDGKTTEEIDEIVQSGILEVLESLNKLNYKIPLSQQVYVAAKRGAGFCLEGRKSRFKKKQPNITFTNLNEDEINKARYLPAEDIDDSTSEFLTEDLARALSTLSPRERKVIEVRFGLEDGEKLTFEQAGELFRVTRERIRQIEAKALRKLRHPTVSKRLEDYVYEDVIIPRRSVLAENVLFRRTVLNPGATPDYKELDHDKTQARENIWAGWSPENIIRNEEWQKWAQEHPLPVGATVDDEIRRYGEYKLSQKEKEDI
ncbi:MAG: sigma-70 family RNA polymerase sigma factor [Candidatus Curtissbacteria bacterium]